VSSCEHGVTLTAPGRRQGTYQRPISAPERFVAFGRSHSRTRPSIQRFYERVNELRMIRQNYAEGSLADAGLKVEETRSSVRETLQTLERTVSKELEAL
jgi:hypothetical protein